MKVYGVTGWKNSGKTTLVERLVAELTGRGLTVSTLKHAHHSFDVDQPGKDSHRHRLAGAAQVLVSSAARWALMSENRAGPEPPLAALLARLDPVDLVLIEGYKRDSHPKIECRRAATAQTLIAPEDPTIEAIASDAPIEAAVPVLPLDDVAAIADFILARTGLAAPGRRDAG
jgi:molybdopterin-guanine dinucleotide biosynthesis adapter protein